jgi:hypothetical protein
VQRAVLGVLAPPRGLGRLARLLGEHDPEGVELRVLPLDALQICVDDLERRHLAVGDQRRLASGAGEGEFGGVHDRRAD